MEQGANLITESFQQMEVGGYLLGPEVKVPRILRDSFSSSHLHR